MDIENLHFLKVPGTVLRYIWISLLRFCSLCEVGGGEGVKWVEDILAKWNEASAASSLMVWLIENGVGGTKSSLKGTKSSSSKNA